MSILHTIEGPIEHYIHIAFTFIKAHPNLGFLFAFLIALSESIPIVGTIVPGSVTMTAIGVLIGSSILPFLSTFIWAVVGAFTGDYIGYYLGYKYNDRLNNYWPFKKYPQILSSGRAFFAKHGGKSIVLGRFLGPLRSVVPMIAGCLQMKRIRFFAAAIPSGIMWALLYLSPGILVGALSQDLPPGQKTKFLVGGVVIVVLLWGIVWVLKTIAMWVYQNYRNFSLNLWYHWHKSDSMAILTAGHTLADDRPLRKTFQFGLYALLFLVTWLNVARHGFLTKINYEVMSYLANSRSVHTYHTLVGITLIGDKLACLGTLALACGYLAYIKDWKAVRFAAGTTLLCAALGYAIKFIMRNPRPEFVMHVSASGSFPSGHVLLTLAVYGSLSYIISAKQPGWIRQLLYWLFAVTLTLVAISRMYLGMHWLTDILGSVFLGLAILNANKIFYATKQEHPKPISLWVISGAVLIPYLLVFALHYRSTLRDTKLKLFHITTTEDYWWQHPEEILPPVRLNRLGHPSQALNIQWSGTLSQIEKQLGSKGWKIAEHQGPLRSTLLRFASYKAQDHMPFLQPKYNFTAPVLTMIRTQASKAGDVELRLWPTAVTLTNSNNQLFIGNISVHYPPKKLLGLKHKERSFYTATSSLQYLQQSIHKDNYTTKLTSSNLDQQMKNKLQWNGKILLIKRD